MSYTQLASEETLTKTVAGLKERGFEPVVVATKEEALAKIKELIPAGVSVMNGASKTLEAIGFVDYLKAEGHGWNNLHKAIVEETDQAKQAQMRRAALTSDYYAGSVHALVETGEMLIASNSGSQLPHIVYSSPNVVFVVGTHKIVPTLADAHTRLWEHVVPLEDIRMKEVYGPEAGTAVNKVFVYHRENTSFTGRKIHVILLKDAIGF